MEKVCQFWTKFNRSQQKKEQKNKLNNYAHNIGTHSLCYIDTRSFQKKCLHTFSKKILFSWHFSLGKENRRAALFLG